MKAYSSTLRTLACNRQRLNRLSIRLYVPRVTTRFQAAKTLVVLPFIMPPREKTMGWKGRLLVGRWRILSSATESRYLLTSRDGSVSWFREVCGTGILVCQADNREIVLGIG
jgi:hypothetical protein